MALEGIFHGITVVELGQYASVPYCAELLAHGGARVIKIEPVAGDQTRISNPIIPGDGRQYVNKSRGKESLAIDITSTEGRDVVRRLCEQADVVLSNMRPGVVERLSLDYDNLREANPRLVYGEVTAFGSSEPRGQLGGVDPVAQAASGLVASVRAIDEGRPVLSDALLTDFMSGTQLAFGIAAALYHRAQTGRGQRVETSLFQAGLALQHQAASLVEATDQWKREFVGWLRSSNPRFDEAFAERRRLVGLHSWWLNTYQTADSYVTIGAPGHLTAKLVELLELPKEFANEPAVVERVAVTKERHAHVASVMKQWETTELLLQLEGLGIPCAKVAFLEEVLIDDDAMSHGYTHKFDHPRLGPMILPAPPVRFSESGYEAAGTTPNLGEHTERILTELGMDADEIENMASSGIVRMEED